MANLCIVYNSNAIKKALAVQPTQGENYKLKGLIFTRNTNPGNPNPSYKDKNSFIVQALFYNNDGSSERVTCDMVYKNGLVTGWDYEFYYVDRNLSLPIEYPTSNSVYKVLDYEFWDDTVGFVLFSKDQLEMLLNQSQQIAVTGAQINYGTGENTSRNSIYSTLKMTSVEGENENPDIPSALIGLPCPPYWGVIDGGGG